MCIAAFPWLIFDCSAASHISRTYRYALNLWQQPMLPRVVIQPPLLIDQLYQRVLNDALQRQQPQGLLAFHQSRLGGCSVW
jgi:hypothetical protein